mgnify:CR=1 FL=1
MRLILTSTAWIVVPIPILPDIHRPSLAAVLNWRKHNRALIEPVWPFYGKKHNPAFGIEALQLLLIIRWDIHLTALAHLN